MSFDYEFRASSPWPRAENNDISTKDFVVPNCYPHPLEAVEISPTLSNTGASLGSSSTSKSANRPNHVLSTTKCPSQDHSLKDVQTASLDESVQYHPKTHSSATEQGTLCEQSVSLS